MKIIASALTVVLLVGFAFASNEGADLVIINAKVRTMAKENPAAEAIAVAGNEIIAVGTTKSILKFAGKETKIIDAKGRLVLPGFNDAHVHFMNIGTLFSTIDLRSVKSSKEMEEKLAHYARFLPKGRWILGGHWNNAGWTAKELPSLKAIDAVTTDNPVLLYHSDPKTAIVNSFALLLAGFGDKALDVPGGEIVRDENGAATGLIRGRAIDLIRRAVPDDHVRRWAEVAETATNYAASLGVTSVQDTHSDDNIDIYRELARQGKLKTRIYDCVTLSEWSKLASKGTRAASGDAMARGGCVKGFSEGDEEEIPELEKEIAGADKAGIQVLMHAIGNKPNQIVLDLFEKTAKENGSRDRRFRVEHAQNMRKSDLSRFGKSKIIASMQPWLFNSEAESNAGFFRTLLDGEAPLAFGSDAAITDLNPLYGIFAAVSGKKSISVEDAVRAYTLGSAYAEFQEKSKGTIEIGKLADFVILSDDIFTVTTSKIKEVSVQMTIVDGRVVFQAE
ncbi:MAG: amidohydrolase [Blastocatellia bacterium]